MSAGPTGRRHGTPSLILGIIEAFPERRFLDVELWAEVQLRHPHVALETVRRALWRLAKEGQIEVTKRDGYTNEENGQRSVFSQRQEVYA